MGKLLSFFLLTSLFGSPWAALAVLIALYWILDRSTLRYLPGPWVVVRRLVHRRRLEGALSHNPHDFRTELELGRLLLDAKRYAAAQPHLERAAGAYQGDASVRAHLAISRVGMATRSGAPSGEEIETGVKELESLMAAHPKLRFGEPWLDGGELLLATDPARAKAMLEKFLQAQPSNVKGLYLLGRALSRAGDRAGGSAARRKAWQEYATHPKFKRREARVWAYRANPWRPALYAACVLATIGAMAMLYR